MRRNNQKGKCQLWLFSSHDICSSSCSSSRSNIPLGQQKQPDILHVQTSGNSESWGVATDEQNINEAKDKAYKTSRTCRFPGETSSTVPCVPGILSTRHPKTSLQSPGLHQHLRFYGRVMISGGHQRVEQ